MSENEIIEGNKLIAEFMGAKMTLEDHTVYNNDGTIKSTPNEDGSKWLIEIWSRPEGISDLVYNKFGWGDYTSGNWHYHTSWDWLMPVVKKASEFNLDENDSRCPELSRLKIDIKFAVLTYKKERIVKALLQFINWYNTQPK